MAQGSDVNGVLEGIKIYVGGYMAGTTDIEMKRIVTMAGGKIMWVVRPCRIAVMCKQFAAGTQLLELPISSRRKA